MSTEERPPNHGHALRRVAEMVLAWRDRIDPAGAGCEVWRALSAIRVAYPEWRQEDVETLVALICATSVEEVRRTGRAYRGPWCGDCGKKDGGDR